jgi:hypothetical protein
MSSFPSLMLIAHSIFPLLTFIILVNTQSSGSSMLLSLLLVVLANSPQNLIVLTFFGMMGVTLWLWNISILLMVSPCPYEPGHIYMLLSFTEIELWIDITCLNESTTGKFTLRFPFQEKSGGLKSILLVL